MKTGFYLSPDGTQIIELIEPKDWAHGFDVIGRCGDFDDNFLDIDKQDANIIFSAWELLE